MRYIATLLFLLVPILGVWTFVTADQYGWWFPENVSSYGASVDHLFNLIMWMVGVTFVATELILAYVVFRFSKKGDHKAQFTHGSHKLELAWTTIPALALLFIAFMQMDLWGAMKYPEQFPHEGDYTIESPIAEVYASQFDWRVRYPDEEGNFRGVDVVETPYEFVVPVDTDIVFNLKSRDVLHSFFVPNFRLKQDAVPGMTIPVWFRAEKVGEYDLVCAELCGWGHYKMAGKVIVKAKDEYEQWLEQARADLYSDGTEDLEDAQ